MSTWLYPLMYVCFAIGGLYLSILSYWYVTEFVKHFITEWVTTDTDATEA
jgi:hypothetical protein